MKRILFLNYEYPPLGGGAANATKCLLEEYAKAKDLKVDLITSAIGSKKEVEMIGKNIKIYHLPIGKKTKQLDYQSRKELLSYSWRCYFFAKRLIRKDRYDLTHSFFSVPCGFISLLLKWQFKIPYIVSLRGSDVPGYNNRFKLLYFVIRPLITLIWRKASFTVTNSHDLTELAKKSAPYQAFLEIPNGVDVIYYTPEERPASIKKKEFRILCASRLTRRKGFKYAISAFAKIYEKFPHSKLIFAGGEGDAMTLLKKQTAGLGLKRAIHFTGHYEKREAPKIYQQSDVFLMTSLNEGMSNNLLEAISSGLPVLMTPTGGAKELIKEGENGFIIKFKNPLDIFKKLEFLIENPEECLRMGRKGRRIAMDLSWKKAAQKYITLYEKTS